MKKIHWSKILNLLIPLSYWSALVAVPLGMSYFFPIFSPFTLVKITWLQILGSFLLLIVVFKLRLWRRSKTEALLSVRFWRLVAPVWLFWLAWALLSVWSLVPVQTWFGSYDRKLGLLTYFWLAIWHSFTVYYFGGFRQREVAARAQAWQNGVRTTAVLMSGVGALIGLYAFLQFCGYDFAVWQEVQLYSRAISTLGQPNFLGSFLLLSLPLSVYYFFSLKTFRWRAWAGFLICFQLAGLIVSGSRAAWLALAVSAGIAALIYAWRRWRYWALLIGPATILLILGIFYFLMPARLSALSNWETGSQALRRYFYQAAGATIAARPWLGTGLENGGEALVGQYQPDWGVFMRIDGYTDKVHNSVLDIIIQTGFVGLFFWLGLYLFWGLSLWRLWHRPGGRSFAAAAAAAIGAYSFSLLFGLSDIAGVFYVWILTALVMAGNASLAPAESERGRGSLHFFSSWHWRRSWSMPQGVFKVVASLISGLLIIFSLGQIYFALNSLQADYYFLQINRLLPERQYFTSGTLYSYLSASSLDPARRQYYQRVFSAYAVADFEQLPDISSRLFVRNLLKEITASLPETGYENLSVQARLHCLFEGVDRARPDFQRLINLSPRRPWVYRSWGACLQSGQKDSEALAAYDQALRLLPDISDPRLNQEHRDYLNFYLYNLYLSRGLVYERQTDYTQALKAYRQAYANYPDDLSVLKKIADIYFLQKDYPAAAGILRHAALRQPNDYHWPLALAALFKNIKEDGLARDYWHQASQLSSTPMPPFSSLLYQLN